MKPMTEDIKSHRVDMSEFGFEKPYGNNGAFMLTKQGNKFFCVISDQEGWDHVSITIKNRKRVPTWDEMCMIKDIFFEETEVAVQYHPAKKDHVNLHPYCLHLWRCQAGMPQPPSIMVGV